MEEAVPSNPTWTVQESKVRSHWEVARSILRANGKYKEGVDRLVAHMAPQLEKIKKVSHFRRV